MLLPRDFAPVAILLALLLQPGLAAAAGEREKARLETVREQRAALIRDPSKTVAVAVMSSPKLTEPEVEAFSRPRFVKRAPLSQYRPDLPAWLDGLLARALSVDPAQRFGDAFTLRLPGRPPLVMVSHPDAIRELFTGDSDDMRAGEANAILDAQAAADPLVGHPLRAPRMVFYRPPVSASRGLNTLSGKYVIRKTVFSFVVAEDGLPRDITVVSTNMNEDQVGLSQRAVSKAIYSPRFADGRPAVTAGVTFTGEWYEEFSGEEPPQESAELPPPAAEPPAAESPAAEPPAA
mgnify:CR=1 FL=1